MALKFCQKCKTPMRPHKNQGVSYFKCDLCGFVSKIREDSLNVSEKIKPTEVKGEGIADDKNSFADYRNRCKKCGHDKAEIIDVGVLYSDEDNLFLLKCGKCGYSERLGKKTT